MCRKIKLIILTGFIITSIFPFHWNVVHTCFYIIINIKPTIEKFKIRLSVSINLWRKFTMTSKHLVKEFYSRQHPPPTLPSLSPELRFLKRVENILKVQSTNQNAYTLYTKMHIYVKGIMYKPYRSWRKFKSKPLICFTPRVARYEFEWVFKKHKLISHDDVGIEFI